MIAENLQGIDPIIGQVHHLINLASVALPQELNYSVAARDTMICQEMFHNVTKCNDTLISVTQKVLDFNKIDVKKLLE